MGFELVRDLCLSLLKIVTAVRAVAEDPAVDGFGHHNPQLGQEDDLFITPLPLTGLWKGSSGEGTCRPTRPSSSG